MAEVALAELERLREVERQHAALADRYTRMAADRARLERDAVAAANREAWDRVIRHWNGVMFGHGRDDLIENHVQGLATLYQRLPDRPQACQRVKEQARLHAAAIADIREGVRTDVDTQMREIERLRDHIRIAGERLHMANGDGPLPCRCIGCELIRGMDTSGEEVA